LPRPPVAGGEAIGDLALHAVGQLAAPREVLRDLLFGVVLPRVEHAVQYPHPEAAAGRRERRSGRHRSCVLIGRGAVEIGRTCDVSHFWPPLLKACT
jgi:hypothetical protein